MQIESFKVFCDLAETHSFTRAAQINSVTQSAVSQTISAMERQLKASLAQRSRKHFRLTREGQIVYDYSKELLEAFRNLAGRMQEAKSAAAGQIRLAVIHSVGLHNLPPCLQEFAQARPAVEVEVEYRRSSQVYEDVLGSVADLGLVAYPMHHPKLEVVPVRQENLVFICHPRHQLAKSKTVKLSVLKGETLVSLSPELPTGRALQRLLRAAGVTPKGLVELDQIDALKSAVKVDAGVGIVPQATVLQEAANQSLAVIAFEDKYSRPLAVIYRKQMPLSPAMSEFIATLKKGL
jgi:LysR family transcriptional regulator, transcriptional activator of the cysJI operon